MGTSLICIHFIGNSLYLTSKLAEFTNTVCTDSPYRTSISQAILHLQEDGTIQNLTRKWWETENTDDDGNQVDCNAGEKEASDTPELDMDNVGGVFLVLCVGLAVAWAIGVLEFFWSVRRVAIDEKVILARKMAFA